MNNNKQFSLYKNENKYLILDHNTNMLAWNDLLSFPKDQEWMSIDEVSPFTGLELIKEKISIGKLRLFMLSN